MSQLIGPNSPAVGFLLALVIGFLVGRTREPGPDSPPRPGMRDFLIIALVGAVAGHIGNPAIAIALFVGTIGAVLVMRAHHPERNGITTELAAIATFTLAALCRTADRPFGAGLGIVLAAILAERDELRYFVRDTISDREYIDTLSFLALIFIIYPLLPTGHLRALRILRAARDLAIRNPSLRRLVCRLLPDQVRRQRARRITHCNSWCDCLDHCLHDGHLASGERRAGISCTCSTLLANSQFNPVPAHIADSSYSQSDTGGRCGSGFRRDDGGGIRRRPGARARADEEIQSRGQHFRNPFSIRPALEFGAIFTVVLLLTRVAKHYAGYGGQMVVSGISGLVDVTAISLTLASFVQAGTSPARDAVIGLTLAHGVNAIFKSAVARSSHQPAFYIRLMAGFAIMFAVGAAAIWVLDPSRVVDMTNHLQLNGM